MQNFKPAGITPRLVEMTRQTLDNHGYGHVKIIVSGGFSPDRIAEFEKRRVPVDAYGVGSYLMRGVNAFTVDVVLLGENPALKSVELTTPTPALNWWHQNRSYKRSQRYPNNLAVSGKSLTRNVQPATRNLLQHHVR
jgi:nicotinic acid phosphoribosyltransferase